MGSLTVPRRQFLRGRPPLAVCAPAVVRAPSLMGVSARFCWSYRAAPPWTAPQEALALLQHEMERRFTETLFGAENLSAEAEDCIVSQGPVVAEAKTTELWELRTLFGPRGSPPKPLEDSPPKSGLDFLRCLDPGPKQVLRRWRWGSLASPPAQAVCPPFDNPFRSWNMTGARSLDYARG
jgi:hypothetical protein